MLSKSKQLGKEVKKMILFASLAIVFILLDFIIYGFFIKNNLILGIFGGLGMIFFTVCLFIGLESSKKYEKELDDYLDSLK